MIVLILVHPLTGSIVWSPRLFRNLYHHPFYVAEVDSCYSRLDSLSRYRMLAVMHQRWRLEYGLALQPANRAPLEGGTRHHPGR